MHAEGLPHMGAYGALGGGGRAGARGKGAKTGRYKGWRQPASAKFSRFEKSKGCGLCSASVASVMKEQS